MSSTKYFVTVVENIILIPPKFLIFISKCENMLQINNKDKMIIKVQKYIKHDNNSRAINSRENLKINKAC